MRLQFPGDSVIVSAMNVSILIYRLTRRAKRLLLPVQRVIFHLADLTLRVFPFLIPKKCKFTVGVEEIARLIHVFGSILPDARRINVTPRLHPFYKNQTYDFQLAGIFSRIFLAPVLFARLLHSSDVFFYFWYTGFFMDRSEDYRILKSRNKKIICAFIGDDIRSVVRGRNLMAATGEDCSWNYYQYQEPVYLTEEYDADKRRIARLADCYADLIFTCEADQPSYLESHTHEFIYAITPEEYPSSPDKFNDLSEPIVLHCPSSPLIKGTQLVRAAIRKLQEEGYRFRYVELTGVAHQEVKEWLGRSHIVLNQFYAKAPGMFGIEALITANAVLMSADPESFSTYAHEPGTPWAHTPYFQIEETLRKLLDNPEQISRLAEAGRRFAMRNYSPQAARDYYLGILRDRGLL